MIDHLVLFTLRDEVSEKEAEELVGELRALKKKIPNVLELTAGSNFSERGGGYTHGLFVRFYTLDDLRAYASHPEHVAVVEKLDALTTGRIAVDYEH